MASVDTNVLARWIVHDNEAQVAVVEKLFLTSAPLYVSSVVLAELEHVLDHVYGFSRQLIHGHFSLLISSGYFELNERVLSATLDQYIEHLALSFIDCWLAVEVAILDKGPLYTFDKKLASQTDIAERPK